jgi:spoIIIJ-associated protein
MEWVVTTAKSVEQAKDAALDELGVDEADAEFEILEEPRQGLFGRQRGEARVRARVRPTVPRPKVDRRDRKRRPKSEATSSISDHAGVAANSDDGADSSGESHSGRAKSSRNTPSAPTAAGGPRRRSSNKTSKATAELSAESTLTSAITTDFDDSDEKETATVTEEDLSLQEQGEVAQQFLVGLLDRFALQGDVGVVELDEDTVEVRVGGEELGLMVGPKGQTLAAVQELTRTVVQRRTPGRTGRLMVDIAGYRQRRREALERFTRQVAGDVVSSGIPKVLEAMSAADRKVVHDTANSIEGVRTTSEGEDPNRRVVLSPDSGS